MSFFSSAILAAIALPDCLNRLGIEFVIDLLFPPVLALLALVAVRLCALLAWQVCIDADGKTASIL